MSLAVERDGATMTVRLQGSDGNRLDWPTIATLHGIVRDLAASRSARVLVLCGDGEDFCAGLKDGAMGEWPESHAGRRPGGSQGPAPLPLIDLLADLRTLPVPTVAAVAGRAIGAGLDLACHCDVRLAMPSATFADDRVARGQHVDTGVTYVLPRLVGLSQTARLLLLGEAIDGAEAQRIGLVTRLATADQPLAETTRALARQIAQMATKSWSLVKQQVLDQLDLDYRSALIHSMGIRQTNVIVDREEGQKAFFEKRPPRYVGR